MAKQLKIKKYRAPKLGDLWMLQRYQFDLLTRVYAGLNPPPWKPSIDWEEQITFQPGRPMWEGE